MQQFITYNTYDYDHKHQTDRIIRVGSNEKMGWQGEGSRGYQRMMEYDLIVRYSARKIHNINKRLSIINIYENRQKRKLCQNHFVVVVALMKPVVQVSVSYTVCTVHVATTIFQGMFVYSVKPA